MPGAATFTSDGQDNSWSPFRADDVPTAVIPSSCADIAPCYSEYDGLRTRVISHTSKNTPGNSPAKFDLLPLISMGRHPNFHPCDMGGRGGAACSITGRIDKSATAPDTATVGSLSEIKGRGCLFPFSRAGYQVSIPIVWPPIEVGISLIAPAPARYIDNRIAGNHLICAQCRHADLPGRNESHAQSGATNRRVVRQEGAIWISGAPVWIAAENQRRGISRPNFAGPPAGDLFG